MRHAFHHVAIAANEIRVMIDDWIIRAIEQRSEQCFTNRHPYCVSNTLTKRTSRRLNARSVSIFGMPGCPALPLAELFDIVEREIVSREIEHAVEKHRCVAGRQNESIAIQPVWIFGVVTQMSSPQHIRERRERHRCAGMA